MDNETSTTIPVPKPAADKTGWVLDETITDVNASTTDYFFRRHLTGTLTAILLAGIWVAGSFVFLTNSQVNMNSPAALVVFFPLIGLIIYTFATYNRIRHEFYQQFSQANGFSYQKSGSLDLRGALFDLGHSRSTSDIIKGTWDDNPLTLFNYQYAIGSGKQRHTYSDTVFQIEYPSVLPPILLIVDNQYFGGITPMFGGWEKIQPEGNFDRTFDLHAKKGYEIETLQIFSPDFMQAMLTKWPEFNLEFNGNRLIVFHNHTIITKAELQKMYELVRFLITKLEPQALGMESSLKALNSQYTEGS